MTARKKLVLIKISGLRKLARYAVGYSDLRFYPLNYQRGGCRFKVFGQATPRLFKAFKTLNEYLGGKGTVRVITAGPGRGASTTIELPNGFVLIDDKANYVGHGGKHGEDLRRFYHETWAGVRWQVVDPGAKLPKVTKRQYPTRRQREREELVKLRGRPSKRDTAEPGPFVPNKISVNGGFPTGTKASDFQVGAMVAVGFIDNPASEEILITSRDRDGRNVNFRGLSVQDWNEYRFDQTQLIDLMDTADTVTRLLQS